MKKIFVNLKRFEVSRKSGGLCTFDSPIEWIDSVIEQTINLGLGCLDDVQLVYLLPEGLVHAAARKLVTHPISRTRNLKIGCQGVHWDDIRPGKNFGAFTSLLPAASAKNLGSSWAIIGHSEERRAKLQLLQAFEQGIAADDNLRRRAAETVNNLIGTETLNALQNGLNVLMCVGETAEERGEGTLDDQKPRIEKALAHQVLAGLKSVVEAKTDLDFVIGYEPIWAIGPGKTPPGKEYIAFVSALIKKIARDHYGIEPTVVYGGGLKEDNAAMIASIDTIGGGLIALTRFSGEIGFYVDELQKIIAKYLEK
jgi:triosephosphate isomerase (TIM)